MAVMSLPLTSARFFFILGNIFQNIPKLTDGFGNLNHPDIYRREQFLGIYQGMKKSSHLIVPRL